MTVSFSVFEELTSLLKRSLRMSKLPISTVGWGPTSKRTTSPCSFSSFFKNGMGRDPSMYAWPTRGRLLHALQPGKEFHLSTYVVRCVNGNGNRKEQKEILSKYLARNLYLLNPKRAKRTATTAKATTNMTAERVEYYLQSWMLPPFSKSRYCKLDLFNVSASAE